MTTTATTPAAMPAAAAPKWQRWAGRALSALPVLMMLFSASMKLSHAPQFVAMWTGKLGFQEGSLTAVGLLELACVAAYAFPRTAVLGAALLSAYLGGAVATHVRIGDPFVVPVVLGLMVWAGLYLRDARVRALVPLRAAP